MDDCCHIAELLLGAPLSGDGDGISIDVEYIQQRRRLGRARVKAENCLGAPNQMGLRSR